MFAAGSFRPSVHPRFCALVTLWLAYHRGYPSLRESPPPPGTVAEEAPTHPPTRHDTATTRLAQVFLTPPVSRAAWSASGPVLCRAGHAPGTRPATLQQPVCSQRSTAPQCCIVMEAHTAVQGYTVAPSQPSTAMGLAQPSVCTPVHTPPSTSTHCLCLCEAVFPCLQHTSVAQSQSG